MTEGLRFEPFDRRRHDRNSFHCGVSELDDYLKTKLGQHSRKDLTRGFVLADANGRIAGYFTLAASRLNVSVIVGGHGLPAKMPLPATLLRRLAVDRSFRGHGLGELLLMHALRVAVETSEIVASAAIEVDAKDDRAQAFYQKYGFVSLADDRLHLYLSMQTAREMVEQLRR